MEEKTRLCFSVCEASVERVSAEPEPSWAGADPAAAGVISIQSARTVSGSI